MQDAVYAVTEIVGSSRDSLEDAIRSAVQTGAKTLRNLEWFEVTQIRGHVEKGDVAHFQVMLKLGLRYEQGHK
jgi:flavin-binding protein dodecin